MPPEYGSPLYWETRFRSDPSAYEWLVDPTYFHAHVLSALSSHPSPTPKLLHIGCGSSELSYHLRFLVDSPAQVHNVDFSTEAIELGRKHDDEAAPMLWKAVDLLDCSHIEGLRGDTGEVGVIVDKGTADSVACGYPRPLNNEHFELVKGTVKSVALDTDASASDGSEKLSPECLLALHLAHLTAQGSQWICVSFSAGRFDFLGEMQTLLPAGGGKAVRFRMSDLWKLEKREAIEIEEDVKNERQHVVHRPKIVYWLYVLRRL